MVNSINTTGSNTTGKTTRKKNVKRKFQDIENMTRLDPFELKV